MKLKTEKKPKIPIIIIYSLVFYALWALWELFGRSAVGSVVSNEFLLEFITEGIIKPELFTPVPGNRLNTGKPLIKMKNRLSPKR